MRLPAFSLLFLLTLLPGRTFAQLHYEPYTFHTIAGEARHGSEDGMRGIARFNRPMGLTTDKAGNIYLADTYNHTIRRITTGGDTVTLAGLYGVSGSSDGIGTQARFYYPTDVAVDPEGNIYVADCWNHTIRKITPDLTVTTLAGLAGQPDYADGKGSNARFAHPAGVAVDSKRNIIVADGGSGSIRKIAPDGQVSYIAGARNPGDPNDDDPFFHFNYSPEVPYLVGLAVDAQDNIYVADWNGDLRMVTPSGIVSTVAHVRFPGSYGDVTLDDAGQIYVFYSDNAVVQKVSPPGSVAIVAGGAETFGYVNGPAGIARFGPALGLALDPSGNIYVADTANSAIRKIITNGDVSTFAGKAPSPVEAGIPRPQAVVADQNGNLFVADEGLHVVSRIAFDGTVSIVAGTKFVPGSTNGFGGAAQFHNPQGLAIDREGTLYVADTYNHLIRKIATNGLVSTLAGMLVDTNKDGIFEGGYRDGPATEARFDLPRAIAIGPDNAVYIVDLHGVRMVSPAGEVTTLNWLPKEVGGIAVDAMNNLYLTEPLSHRILKGAPDHVLTVLAGPSDESTPGGFQDGNSSEARFNRLAGIALDAAGNLYVTDTLNFLIRKIAPTGITTTLAGFPEAAGSMDGTGAAARFGTISHAVWIGTTREGPAGLAVDKAGNVYVADPSNGTVRKGSRASVLENLVSQGGSFRFDASGPTGASFVVEESGDLISWRSISTNRFPDSPTQPLKAGRTSGTFFRVRLN